MSAADIAEVRSPVPEGALRAAFVAPLSQNALAAALGQPGWLVETVQETGSTNGDLLARVRATALRQPVLRAALAQTAGRGRMGRRWHAAPGSALLFSVALPLAGAQAAPTAVTLAIGVALAETLARFDAALDDLRLKWPNDLLQDDAKLGGVLVELAVDRGGARTLVAGVGINLWLDAAARASIGAPAAALAARVALPRLAAQREALIGGCAAALAAAVDGCLRDGFVPVQARFMRRFAHRGERVEISEHGARIAHGRALGVDGDGRLLLEIEGRVVAFGSGQVSVRPAAVRSIAATAATAADSRPQSPAAGGRP